MSRFRQIILNTLIATILFSASPFLHAQTCVSQIPATTPTSRFFINSNGTVTDNLTGLVWKRCLEGVSGLDCNIGAPIGLNWEQALQHAANASFAGISDWRFPNIKELASIVEQQCFEPAINLAVFPAQPTSLVWSSSPDAEEVNAWFVNFGNGNTGSISFRNTKRLVRLVRDNHQRQTPQK